MGLRCSGKLGLSSIARALLTFSSISIINCFLASESCWIKKAFSAHSSFLWKSSTCSSLFFSVDHINEALTAKKSEAPLPSMVALLMAIYLGSGTPLSCSVHDFLAAGKTVSSLGMQHAYEEEQSWQQAPQGHWLHLYHQSHQNSLSQKQARLKCFWLLNSWVLR